MPCHQGQAEARRITEADCGATIIEIESFALAHAPMSAIRIRRSRVKGSRLASPNGLPIECVSRPSKWGNPFSIGKPETPESRAASVEHFARELRSPSSILPFTVDDIRRELTGKNLACWCPLDEPCHADVLLELAAADRENDDA
jgi:hypothetical protein